MKESAKQVSPAAPMLFDCLQITKHFDMCLWQYKQMHLVNQPVAFEVLYSDGVQQLIRSYEQSQGICHDPEHCFIMSAQFVSWELMITSFDVLLSSQGYKWVFLCMLGINLTRQGFLQFSWPVLV